MLRRLLLLALAGALLAACGSNPDTGSAPPANDGGAHNDADLAFVRGMIPHHQQALDMAELVERSTNRPELRSLADAIIANQGRELGLMQSWLRAWAEETDGTGDGHMSGHGEALGMMPQARMDELMGMKNAKFDLAFIEMMTEHHQGAIDMAETELRDGVNADARRLAAQIMADQRKEIQAMRTWRTAWATS